MALHYQLGLYHLYIKGQSSKIFYLQFYSKIKPRTWPLTKRFQYFLFWLRIRWVIVKLENLTPRGVRPRAVKNSTKTWAGTDTPTSQPTRVWSPESQSSPGPENPHIALHEVWYGTPGSNVSVSPSLRGLIPGGVRFFEPKTEIIQRNWNRNQKYFNSLVSCPGRIEWWTKLEVENLVTLPL